MVRRVLAGSMITCAAICGAYIYVSWNSVSTTLAVLQSVWNQKDFIEFTYPSAVSAFDSARIQTIQWKYSDEAIPSEYTGFDIYFRIVDARGFVGGVIAIVHAGETSAEWNIPTMARAFPDFYKQSGPFRIEATMKYTGNEPFTCASKTDNTNSECMPVYAEPLQSKTIAAAAYKSVSEPFLIVPAR